MNRYGMTPYKLQITSCSVQQSALWAGRFGALEVRKVVQVDNSGLFITTTVTVKNVDTAPITDYYCKYCRFLFLIDTPHTAHADAHN